MKRNGIPEQMRQNFERMDTIDKKQERIYQAFTQYDLMNPWLDTDEAMALHNYRMEYYKTPKQDLLYDAAYQAAKKYYGTLDRNNPKHVEAFSDWSTFFRTGSIKHCNVDNAIDILSKLDSEKNSRQNLFNSASKLMGLAFAIPGGGQIAAAMKAGQISWNFVKSDAESTVVGNHERIYKEFLDKFGKDPHAIAKLLSHQHISISPEVNKALLTMLFENADTKKAEAMAKKLFQKMQHDANQKIKSQPLDPAAQDKKAFIKQLAQEFQVDLNGPNIETLLARMNAVEKNTADALTVMQSFKDAQQYTKLQDLKFTQGEIYGVQQGFQLLMELGRFVKSPELIKVAQMGQGFTNIISSINQFQQIKVLQALGQAGSLALAGGIFGIGLAVLSLVSSFFNTGPSPEEVILDYLQKMTDYIEKQFGHLNKRLDAIHKDMIASFRHMEQISRDHFKTLAYLVTDTSTVTQGKLDLVERHIKWVEQLVKSGQHQLQYNQFAQVLRRIDDIHSGNSQENIQHLLNTLVGDYIEGMSTNLYQTGHFYYDEQVFQSLSPRSETVMFSPYTSIDHQFITHPSRHEQSEKILSLLSNMGSLDSALGFFAKYAADILHRESMSKVEIEAQLSHLKNGRLINQKRQQALDAELASYDKKTLSEAEQQMVAGMRREQQALIPTIIHSQMEAQHLATLLPLAAEKEAHNQARRQRFRADKERLEQEESKLSDKDDELHQSFSLLQREISIHAGGLTLLYNIQNSLGIQTPLGEIYRSLYEKYLDVIHGQASQAQQNLEDFWHWLQISDEKSLHLSPRLSEQMNSQMFQSPAPRANHVLLLSTGSKSIAFIQDSNSEKLSHLDNKRPHIFYDQQNLVVYAQPFQLSTTYSLTENIVGSASTRLLLNQINHVKSIFIALDYADLEGKALGLEKILEVIINGIDEDALCVASKSIVWGISNIPDGITQEDINVEMDARYQFITQRAFSSGIELDKKKQFVLETFNRMNGYIDLSKQNALLHISQRIRNRNPLATKLFDTFADGEIKNRFGNALNILFEKGSQQLAPLAMQSKDMRRKQAQLADIRLRKLQADLLDDTESGMKNVDGSVYRYKSSTGYENVALPTLVFNPHVWQIATLKYLQTIESDTAAVGYQDKDLRHIHRIITMAENFHDFFKRLRNPNLFKHLWRAYAHALLFINEFYHHQYEEYLADQKTKNNNEAIAQPALLKPHEIEFARKILNTKEKVEHEFEKFLTILEAQKQLLVVYSKLTGYPFNWLELPGKDIMIKQLQSLIQFAKPSSWFSATEVYEHLNAFSAQLDKGFHTPNVISDTERLLLLPTISKLLQYRSARLIQYHLPQQIGWHTSRLLGLPTNTTHQTQFNCNNKEKTMPKKQTYEEIFIAAMRHADMKNAEAVYLTFGRSGDGKSTFICYFLGCEMQYIPGRTRRSQVVDIKKCPNPSGRYPVIGQKMGSETLFPAGYTFESASVNRRILDFPGFRSTREDTSLLELIATQVAIKTTKSVQGIVFVVSWKAFTDEKSIDLEESLEALATMFKDPKEKLPLINLIISHLPRDGSVTKSDVLERLRDLLTHKLRQSSVEQTSKSINLQGFLEYVLGNPQNIILFDPLKNDARIKLLDNLQKNTPFPSSDMSLVGSEAKKNDFLRYVLKVISDGNRIFNRLLQLPPEIQIELNKETELGELVKRSNTEIVELEGNFFDLLLMQTSSAVETLDLEKLSNDKPLVLKVEDKHYIYGKNEEKKWVLRELPHELVAAVSLPFPPKDSPAQCMPLGSIQSDFYQIILEKKLHCHEPDTEKELEKINQLIKDQEAEIQRFQDKISHIEQVTIPAFRKALMDINRKTQQVIFQTRNYSERQSFGNGRKVGQRDRTILTYNGEAFSHAHKYGMAAGCAGGVNDQGQFEGEDSKPAEGKYTVTYVDPKSCYGSATVDIFMEERNTPVYQQKKKELESNIITAERDVQELKGKVVLFNQGLAALRLQYGEACIKLAVDKLALKKTLLEAKKAALDIYHTNQTEVLREKNEKEKELNQHLGNLTQNAPLYGVIQRLQAIVNFELESYNTFKTLFEQVKSKHATGYYENFETFDSETAPMAVDVEDFQQACLNGDIDQVKSMLADDESVIHEKNKQGLMALDVLLEANSPHLEVIKSLLISGSSCSAQSVTKLIQKSAQLYEQYPAEKDRLERQLKLIRLSQCSDYSSDTCGPQTPEPVQPENARHSDRQDEIGHWHRECEQVSSHAPTDATSLLCHSIFGQTAHAVRKTKIQALCPPESIDCATESRPDSFLTQLCRWLTCPTQGNGLEKLEAHDLVPRV